MEILLSSHTAQEKISLNVHVFAYDYVPSASLVPIWCIMLYYI